MINLNTGVVLTQTVINNITETDERVTNIQTEINNVQTNITGLDDEIDKEFHHDTQIFPEQSNYTWVPTAGSPNNTYGDWAEIIDSNSITLQSKDVVGYHLHISAVVLEDASVKDKVYTIEIAYGDNKTPITAARFMTGNTKEGAANSTKVRAEHIPHGEQIFYRLQCETAGATCQLHLRFHIDPEEE